MKYNSGSKIKNEYDNTQANSNTVPFAIIEAYKAVRTNLMFILSQSKSRVFEISSSLPGEGKSSCAVNLAIAFSQLGSKVLMIDADLRKPSIHRKLHLQNTNGLSSVLVDFCNFDEAVISVNENIDVMTSGPTPPNPSELLGSEKMAELLERVKNNYEYIIIDTPPINVVSDAVVLAPRTEGIVMVVQDRGTTHEQFKKAVSSLGFANAKLLGVILNSSAEKGKKYYSTKKMYQY